MLRGRKQHEGIYSSTLLFWWFRRAGGRARQAIEGRAAGAAIQPHDRWRCLRAAFAADEIVVDVGAASHAEVA
jgi:hypothetical protein